MKMNLFKFVPNFLTSMNLFSGFIAILLNDPFYSPILIVAGGFFDLFDGAVARKVNASSELGKQLDSLADLVSFGVAPAFLYYHHILHGYSLLHIISVGFIVVFTALRLAKFNIDSNQTSNFLGLPSPASGLFFAFLIWESSSEKYLDFTENTIFWQILPIIISFLMVSNIKFYALKKSNFKYDQFIKYFIIIIFTVAGIIWILTGFPSIPIAFIIYILASMIYYKVI